MLADVYNWHILDKWPETKMNHQGAFQRKMSCNKISRCIEWREFALCRDSSLISKRHECVNGRSHGFETQWDFTSYRILKSIHDDIFIYIISNKTCYCRMSLWLKVSGLGVQLLNRSISQIIQCIIQISHNAPFSSRNVHICKMVHFCGIWDRGIVGFVQ